MLFLAMQTTQQILDMKRVVTANIIVAIAINCYSQLINDTIYFNRSWQQSDKEYAQYYRVISNDTSGKIQFIVKDYYISGPIQMAGTYKSINPDFKTGDFRYWYENGQSHIECNFLNNKLNGDYVEYYENGQPRVSRRYAGGVIDGVEKTWSLTGLLSKVVEYRHGARHGRFMTYYENGQLTRKDIYKNDEFIRGRCFTHEGKDTAYFEYFIMPAFQGGLEGFKKFILEGIRYPEQASRNDEEAKVYLSFTVDRQGNVIKARIVKPDKEYFNEEVMRVISLSPKWIPGRKDGKIIDVSITIPILFRIIPH
jgi:TonB family protein